MISDVLDVIALGRRLIETIGNLRRDVQSARAGQPDKSANSAHVGLLENRISGAGIASQRARRSPRGVGAKCLEDTLRATEALCATRERHLLDCDCRLRLWPSSRWSPPRAALLALCANQRQRSARRVAGATCLCVIIHNRTGTALLLTGNEIGAHFGLLRPQRPSHRAQFLACAHRRSDFLLFTNAGMNQFKDVFPASSSAITSGPLPRRSASGRRRQANDLENVGFTNRHLTFFEMLGTSRRLSQRVIAFAWEPVTSPPWADSAFLSTSCISHRLRRGDCPRQERFSTTKGSVLIQMAKVGKPRVIAVPGLKENFWAKGDTGPCGPCSEFTTTWVLRLPTWATRIANSAATAGRYVEIQPIHAAQPRRRGNVTPLPRPSIDTTWARGFSRAPDRRSTSKDPHLRNGPFPAADRLCRQAFRKAWARRRRPTLSLHTLDYSRASAFLIGDGVMPSNECHGYVLRKIICRARHGRMLGLERPFLFEMAQQVAEQMREAYPELLESIGRVTADSPRGGALRSHYRHRPEQAR